MLTKVTGLSEFCILLSNQGSVLRRNLFFYKSLLQIRDRELNLIANLDDTMLQVRVQSVS